jgi:hypothetical protein
MSWNSLIHACRGAGLLLLADVNPLSLRTALRGTSSLWEALILCPGLHRQQKAAELSQGEYPACAAMTTGYVFRVENEATVLQLQRVGKPGHLTTLNVSSVDDQPSRPSSTYAYCALMLTMAALLYLSMCGDVTSITSLLLLLAIRLVNTIIFRNRSRQGWKGAPEPGVRSDLIVLLSQDRWVRVQGLTDDVKAITSGQWLRHMTFVEDSLISCCTLLTYLNAGLTNYVTTNGAMILCLLFFLSAALLGLENSSTSQFQMYGRQITQVGLPRPYRRRLDLAEQLIEETGRKDWAVRLGMIQPGKADIQQETDLGPKVM